MGCASLPRVSIALRRLVSFNPAFLFYHFAFLSAASGQGVPKPFLYGRRYRRTLCTPSFEKLNSLRAVARHLNTIIYLLNALILSKLWPCHSEARRCLSALANPNKIHQSCRTIPGSPQFMTMGPSDSNGLLSNSYNGETAAGSFVFGKVQNVLHGQRLELMEWLSQPKLFLHPSRLR